MHSLPEVEGNDLVSIVQAQLLLATFVKLSDP